MSEQPGNVIEGRQIKGFLFDLDGTLLDSAPDLAAALNKVRADYDLSPLPIETVRAGVSRGAAGMLGLGFPEASETEYKLIRKKFLEYYADGSTELSRPFPGIPQFLDQLDNNNIPWAIVTNKGSRLTLPIVAALGWQQRAKIVVCGDTTDEPKPSAKPVLLACDALQLAPINTVMVGDDERDIQAGRNAGCATASVSWGYGDPNSAGLLTADFQCQQVNDMADLLPASSASAVSVAQ